MASNTYEILLDCFNAQSGTVNISPDNTYEIFQTIYDSTNSALRVSIEGFDPDTDILWEVGTGTDSLIAKNTLYPNVASSDYAVAEGRSTIAGGIASHTEGINTETTGNYGHAEGNNTIAGDLGHAEGNATEATGYVSHAEGSGSIASSNNTHAEGLGTIASGFTSHSQGRYTQANGKYTHAAGTGNSTLKLLANGECSFNHSNQLSTSVQYGAYGNYSAILGGTDNNITTAATGSVILGGTTQTLSVADTVMVPKLVTSEAGEGVTMKTPDGTKEYKITIDNSGNLVSTLVV